ncbi:hypothetical protein [Xanthomonas axonopodis]|uniref:hypothetical protein n=1 Tax=Xanthomonas axonopodis TaxID=53413 RepID=UPI003555E5F7
MVIQSPLAQQDVERARQLWLLVGIGAMFYLLIHTLQTIFLGVPPSFAGKEQQAMWGFTALIGIVLLPVLLSFIGTASLVAWFVLGLGLLGALLMAFVIWQYGIVSGAGYITLAIVLFVLVPQGLALWRTFRWARAKS